MKKPGNNVVRLFAAGMTGVYLADVLILSGDLKLDAPPKAALVASSTASDTGHLYLPLSEVVDTITDNEYPVVRKLPPFPTDTI